MRKKKKNKDRKKNVGSWKMDFDHKQDKIQ